jgi:hypothetical protein
MCVWWLLTATQCRKQWHGLLPIQYGNVEVTHNIPILAHPTAQQAVRADWPANLRRAIIELGWTTIRFAFQRPFLVPSSLQALRI